MRRGVNRLASLVWKDWLLFFADRRAAILCFAVPVILASAFGLIFDRSAARSAATRLPVAIVADERHPANDAILAALLESPRLDASTQSYADAMDAVERRQVSVAIILPRGTDSVSDPRKPEFELVHHPQAGLESQWAEGVLTEVLMRRAAKEWLGPLAGTLDGKLDRGMPFAITRRTPKPQIGRAFDAYGHSFAGMTLQYLLFWGMESGLMFLRERQSGLWRRLRTMPISLGMLLLGRTIATAGIALLQVLITFAVGWLLFGVQVTGSWTAFAALALCISVLSAATGLLVASLGGTESRARSVSILVILSVSMLGGLWLPSFLLPDWVRQLALSLPTTWAMNAFELLLRNGQGWWAVLPALGMILAFTIAFAAVAVARFHQIEQRQRRGWVPG
ncbi:ABC transporter permease [Tuwongella immobilis]|uniref:ABC transmembrane type-2 domain-containing protein n=1 Tax=Tuwongella immobilis TaxID=692036 RepID=A0A6C2YVN7_9BACT|nr:ABC transporter permease [Tuwongella immobilis]VIP04932.1 abc-2 type transporter : ABC-2 type transporter OS=Fimbriimonas ginsengisoli Gsoil 348 GN=OP10G_4703 PE=4 SV=1: ABC2_membrane_3 [Tuwongella immobilis]VTS07222.1 abc-2 type transporter : ABC-2 type transporter OS=Fimbriimonas ginsengisoli Gsoil 348 GN=OP10G_4703 PE=4 SV=1: ABC2_membrane_3 [Tuwongella immobilis]